jgi:hypothetical protein
MSGSKDDTETVRAFFQDMRARGLGDPLLVASHGVAGIIRAIEECFPRSTRQRCLAHRMCNLAVKVSKLSGIISHDARQTGSASILGPCSASDALSAQRRRRPRPRGMERSSGPAIALAGKPQLPPRLGLAGALRHSAGSLGRTQPRDGASGSEIWQDQLPRDA